MNLPQVTIYTDGGCNPNPGPGGWAAVLLFPQREPQELTGNNPDTTNNQMELQAAIEALHVLPEPHQIAFYTDSTYLRQGVTDWLPQWERRGWRTTQRTAVKNQAQWQELAAASKGHQIDWYWIRGHAGDKWNERVDQLARAAIPKPRLPLDDEGAIHLFAAGSYLGKVKKGGWAVVLRYRDAEKSLTGQISNTSSNRMHLQAAIEGLKAIKKPLPIHLYTASDYLKDGATLWTPKWQTRNWQTKEGKPVSNRDLWESLVNLTQTYQIHWHVVSKDNIPPEMARAKKLAGEAARTD
jgi:ribonuclease HI